jgi:hypothetical protein
MDSLLILITIGLPNLTDKSIQVIDTTAKAKRIVYHKVALWINNIGISKFCNFKSAAFE